MEVESSERGLQCLRDAISHGLENDLWSDAEPYRLNRHEQSSCGRMASRPIRRSARCPLVGVDRTKVGVVANFCK